MTKIIITLLFLTLLFTHTVYSQDKVYVDLKSGHTYETEIVSVQKFTVLNQNLLIGFNSTGNAQNFDLPEIRRIRFSASVVNNIEEAEIISGVILYPSQTRDYVYFKNIEGENLLVEIYSLTGLKVLSETIYDLSLGIDVKSLPQGLYILKIGDNVLKFKKI